MFAQALQERLSDPDWCLAPTGLGDKDGGRVMSEGTRDDGPSYDEAQARLLSAATTTRIYGVAIDDAPSPERFLTVLYCGWSSQGEEKRQGSRRIIRMRRGDVTDSGEVPDFTHEGSSVRWYDVDLGAQLIEELHIALPASALLPFGFGHRLGDVPITIDPNGPRPTQSPPLTINP